MSPLLIILVVLLLFGGGGFYGFRQGYYGPGTMGGLGFVLVIILLIVLFTGVR